VENPIQATLSPKKLHLLVYDGQIEVALDWQNQMVPYIFPKGMPLQEDTLMGTLFGLLGNFEKTWDYLAQSPWLAEWDNYVRLLQGHPIALEPFEKQTQNTNNPHEVFRAWHHLALIYYYIYPQEANSVARIEHYFRQAVEAASSPEMKCFTTKHYANFLLDAEQIDRAESLLADAVTQVKGASAQAAVRFAWVQVMMKKLAVPYDMDLLDRLKTQLWEALQYYEAHQCPAEAALLLMDASMIANIENSFAESLGYVNKAIQLFKQEELAQLIGEACLRKGILLYTWSKNGQPQFYRPALEAFQEALKYFDKENAPDVFADIHHHLGIVYAEMPDENKKRSIWAALSASSFKEALDFFDKQNYPYEYAVVANNYANAMTLYPQMKKADNFAKALELYDEALSIRNPDQYPYERALTLMNYLEASWQVSNAEEGFNEERFRDMVSKALEIKALVDDVQLIQEANTHLEALEKLKTSFQQNA
jgi:tetratricopeptide (TPR) repeat protein